MASYFSCTVGEEQQFRVALHNGGMTAELVREVGNNAELGRVMVEALKKVREKPEHPFGTHFTITVDHTKSFAEMVAEGKYDWVHEDITQEHFPVSSKYGARKVGVVVLYLDDNNLTTDEVKEKLDRRGLEPASIVELLAFGAVNPELQREFCVVALGSSWQSPRSYVLRFPCLDVDGDERRSLTWCRANRDWDGYYCFLAVRKTEDGRDR